MPKLLGVIAIAAIAFAVAPVQAAKHATGGCSSANLEQAETAIEAMPDGDGKIVAQKEIASAQDSMINGKMGACGMGPEQGDARQHGEVNVPREGGSRAI